MHFDGIYQFTHTNPYQNIGYEELLFSQISADQSILIFWVNSPAVVIGRSQNPWAEVDTKALEEHEIPLIRRSSGGGTVYHDLGNLCYSIMAPRTNFDRDKHSEFFCQVLKQLGIPAEATPRNDLLAEGKKFSGSAFRMAKQKALHHGTLLINSNLSLLAKLLTPQSPDYKKRGTSSRGMPVINLTELNPAITADTIINAFASHLGQQVIPISPEFLQAQLQAIKKRLTSWDWTYGATPPFTYKGQVEVKKGRVVHGAPTEPSVLQEPFNPEHY